MPEHEDSRQILVQLLACDPGGPASRAELTGTVRTEIRHRCGAWCRSDHRFCSACGRRLRRED